MSRSKLARRAFGLDAGTEVQWRGLAACRTGTPEYWTLVSQRAGAGPVRVSEQNLAALRICRTGPVRIECHDEWASLPPLERGGFIAGGAVWSPRGVEVSDYRRPKEVRSG